MAFTLQSVVPWGRSLEEYESMFALSQSDLSRRIISFGDGPASFNAQMHERGKKVTSVDPIYQFTQQELKGRIDETVALVMEQTCKNMDNFTWHHIASPDELRRLRVHAMETFLDDFEAGRTQQRYIAHSLPQQLPFDENSFDLGLSSHFLFLYSQLGLTFHISAISEMIRLCKEIRIFPLINLDAKKTVLAQQVIDHFSKHYMTRIVTVSHEFQKGGNEMLQILT